MKPFCFHHNTSGKWVILTHCPPLQVHVLVSSTKHKNPFYNKCPFYVNSVSCETKTPFTSFCISNLRSWSTRTETTCMQTCTGGVSVHWSAARPLIWGCLHSRRMNVCFFIYVPYSPLNVDEHVNTQMSHYAPTLNQVWASALLCFVGVFIILTGQNFRGSTSFWGQINHTSDGTCALNYGNSQT